ncbi:AraC family transcriptional regulator [Jannaschia sp. 2305UL9-9]|uniref:AraC family transcriptional regulator n=1 Tax=Jannaschia sp. 2305UL9-9 TaxID=3121638 RepID=UPI003528AB92
MSRIRLFESRDLSEAERLAGLRLEPITPLSRTGRWRRETPHAEHLPVLIWIARGQGRVMIDAQTRGFGPTSCIVIPANTAFSIEPTPMTEGTLVCLPDLFEAPLPATPRRLRMADISAQSELSGLLDRLGQAGDLTDAANGRAALARVILISALIERQARNAPPETPSGPAKLARRFAREVEARLGNGDNLAVIGDALDVTPTHLTRTLRATCNMTAAQYMTARHIHAASLRLADTDHSAANIAQSLGFGSAAYFTRAFGKATGKTPTQFRQSEGRMRTN